MPQLSKINRWAAAGLAVAALAPASAAAIPVGGPVAPGASQTVTPQQDWRAPDQVAGSTAGRQAPGPPTWPTNPQTLTPPRATTASPSDDGIDAGVLIAIGGAAAIGVAGLGVARRKRVTAVRRQQLA